MRVINTTNFQYYLKITRFQVVFTAHLYAMTEDDCSVPPVHSVFVSADQSEHLFHAVTPSTTQLGPQTHVEPVNWVQHSPCPAKLQANSTPV